MTFQQAAISTTCPLVSRRFRSESNFDHLPISKPPLPQRERLSASMLSMCSSVCLSVYRQNAKNAIFSKTKQLRAMVSTYDL